MNNPEINLDPPLINEQYQLRLRNISFSLSVNSNSFRSKIHFLFFSTCPKSRRGVSGVRMRDDVQSENGIAEEKVHKKHFEEFNLQKNDFQVQKRHKH